jgi:hypothetical protein
MATTIENNWDRAGEDSQGLYRWNSNDRIPPAEIIEQFRSAGYLTDAQAEAHNDQRSIENERIMDEYRAFMATYVPTAEERYEMMAAFGAGTKVVNVITGKVTRV